MRDVDPAREPASATVTRPHRSMDRRVG